MTSELQSTTQRSWMRFLGTYEPLRSELYRYCRHLTRSPWDAEDLAQDALARAFVTLAQMNDDPPNPRAWLFRVASNLWIDQMRRRREVATARPVPEASASPSPTNTDRRRHGGRCCTECSSAADCWPIRIRTSASTFATAKGRYLI